MSAISVLRGLGLSEIEAKVYAALASLGPSKAGGITAETGLHKATVYITLNNLYKKGLASFVLSGKVRKWQATEPEILLEQLKEKEMKLQETLPLLRPRQKDAVFAKVLEGKEGLKMFFRELLQYEEYCHLLPGVQMPRILGPFFYQFQLQKRNNKITSKVLLSEAVRGKPTVKKSYGEFRFLPPVYEAPVSTLIYGNKIALIAWTAKIVFILESEEASRAYRKYFDVLWRIAKP